MAGLALPSRGAPHHRAVVCVFLRGGLDGLAAVVPHGDPLYHRARPTIALHSRDVVDLDGYFGLAPGLRALKPFWDAGHLAVVPAAGGTPATASHIEGQKRITERLARLGTAPEVSVVNLWGWDSHLNQGAAGGSLDRRLAALARRLIGISRRPGMVVVTVSEFGRTVGENGTGGTGHGAATVMLVLGDAVDGGRLVGGWPGLEDPAVAVTTDAGAVLEAVVARHLDRSIADRGPLPRVIRTP